MRLSTDEGRDEERAFNTIAAALDAGITLFDTARAYGRDENELGHNERLLASVTRDRGAPARIVTKGGMSRADGGWVPDGRAKSIQSDCDASLEALDGLGIDLYLLHAPDPRTPWRTSIRALARLVDEGIVRSIGVSNVNLTQLDEALDIAPISAVEIALSVYDDRALRGGIVERCDRSGIVLIAHSPLGGSRRSAAIGRRNDLPEIAGATAPEVALAWLLHLSPVIVPIPGARRPETARSAARAATLRLDDEERSKMGALRPVPMKRARRPDGAEIVVIMGIPGAGKTRLAHDYIARGYARFNRDERRGSLRELAAVVDDELASDARSVVLDNTYLTRASRSYVLDVARRHGLAARCIWIDTPLAQAQINLVERLLERFGSLPGPDELKALAKLEEGIVAPTSQMRAHRELETPSADEGWDGVEHVSFVRAAQTDVRSGAVFVAATTVTGPEQVTAIAKTEPDVPHLIFHWDPGGSASSLAPAAEQLAAAVRAPVEVALCPHEGGPPRCWCRPPLPGLLLAFARDHHVDMSRSVVIGASPAHRTMARALGAASITV